MACVGVPVVPEPFAPDLVWDEGRKETCRRTGGGSSCEPQYAQVLKYGGTVTLRVVVSSVEFGLTMVCLGRSRAGGQPGGQGDAAR